MAPTALLRMILSQGDALDRMAGLDLAEPAGVLARAARIILVGTGTSQHAAELGAMMLDAAGRDARWCSTVPSSPPDTSARPGRPRPASSRRARPRAGWCRCRPG